MPYKQFTQCVQPAAYQDPVPHGNFFAILGGIISGGGLDWAKASCAYLLGGKLVCLQGDQCAIGRITHFEPPSEKSFPDSLDNDFSINLLLAPHDLEEFAFDSRINNYYKVANDSFQGKLITEQTTNGQPRDNSNVLMPIPNDGLNTHYNDPADPAARDPSDRYHPYTTDYPSSSYISFDPTASPFQVPGSDIGYSVPALHLECEGSRIYDICQALSSFWDPISNTVCEIPIIGPILCFFISLAVAPLLLPVLAAAWLNAQDGNADDVRVNQSGGQLGLGDRIVVTGRWVYDAGHQGWNELHPVKTIQTIDQTSYQWSDFKDFYTRWCSRVSEVPPYEDPGVHPVGMTPEQSGVYDNQLQPENRWYLHPLVDGCEPAPPPVR